MIQSAPPLFKGQLLHFGFLAVVLHVLSDDGKHIEAASEIHDDTGALVGRGTGLFVRSHHALPNVPF